MYISRVEIDVQDRQKIMDLSHLAAYHNWVEESFPEEFEQSVRSRKLWRLDSVAGKDYLLVISRQKPELDQLERYGVPGSAETKNYQSFLDSLADGQKGRFRATLNPVISVMDNSNGKRGRVMPHITVDHQRKFLVDRSEKNGFRLEDDEFEIVERGFVPFRKKGQKVIRLSKVIYEGILTISDVDLFRKTLTEGVGKKKAYGFGMFTFIPVR